MQAIWKFELPNDERVMITMPGGAEVLHVGAQGDSICLWARVDLDVELEQRRFHVISTGHEHEDLPEVYLGTVLLFNGRLVLHVFELPA